MKIKRLVVIVMACLVGFTGITGCAGKSGRHLDIGIAQLNSHPSLNVIRDGFKQCLGALGYSDVTYDERNPAGDQAALNGIADGFKAADLDLVVAITTPVAQAFARTITDHPIVFAGVTDPVRANLVGSFDKPGGNLTGTSDYPPIADQLQLVKDLSPNAKTIGIVYAPSEANAAAQNELAQQAAAGMGLTVRTATVTDSSEVREAALSLAGVDAFYVGNDNTVVFAIEGVIEAAVALQVPVVAADPDSVKRGAVAAYAVDQARLGCQAATIADQILSGGKPADIPVIKLADFDDALRLTINVNAAQAQGVVVPSSLADRPGITLVS